MRLRHKLWRKMKRILRHKLWHKMYLTIFVVFLALQDIEAGGDVGRHKAIATDMDGACNNEKARYYVNIVPSS